MPGFVMGEATFVGNNAARQRDRAVTRLQTEAASRGLLALSPDPEYGNGQPGAFDPALGITVYPSAGCWAHVVDGQTAVPGARLCYYAADDALIDQTAEDLRAWLDANGKVDGYVGTLGA